VPAEDVSESEDAEEGTSLSDETEVRIQLLARGRLVNQRKITSQRPHVVQDSTENMDDKEFLSALLRIRQGDAAIYDPKLTLFDAATQQPNAPVQAMVPGRKPRRPIYLKDVNAQQVCHPTLCSHPECCLAARAAFTSGPTLAGNGRGVSGRVE